jgi:manganese/zinc/iron transport system substrate-binding protein
VQTLAAADIVFYNGLHLEAQLARVLERMGNRIKTVAVTDAIDRTLLLSPKEFKGNHDPHVWFDVSLWKLATEQVRDALVERDPDHAGEFQARATAYLAQLDELDAYVKDQAARVPVEQRVLITAHDAFNYFGRAYGFEVRGLQGISTATEAGAGDIQDLANFIAEHRIPAIFVETSVSPRTIEALQAAVRSRGHEVAIGGSLYSDAMGDSDTPRGTYIGMVRANIDTIVGALLGEQCPDEQQGGNT